MDISDIVAILDKVNEKYGISAALVIYPDGIGHIEMWTNPGISVYSFDTLTELLDHLFPIEEK